MTAKATSISNYRIKTEEEFIIDYGKEWRDVIKYGWSSHMDMMFGKRIPDRLITGILSGESKVIKAASLLNMPRSKLHRDCNIRDWNISTDMIVKTDPVEI